MEVATAEIINQVQQLVVQKYRDSLEALALVGCFARGEPIIRKDAEGKPVYVSEVELLAVVREDAHPAAMDAEMLEKALNGQVKISITQLTRGQLEKLRPTIFAVELKKFGKVLHGDQRILNSVPAYRPKDVDSHDAFVLLNDAIVEQLTLRRMIDGNGGADSYYIDKGYVQLVNSLLAITGRYQFLYSDKLKAFEEMDRIKSDVMGRFINTAFAHIYLGQGGWLDKGESLPQWDVLREAMKKIWLYEVQYFLNSRVKLEVAIKVFPKVAPVMQRVRGWSKLFKEKKAPILGRFGLKDIFGTSPQYLIYKEAVSLYFAERYDKDRVEKVVNKWRRLVAHAG